MNNGIFCIISPILQDIVVDLNKVMYLDTDKLNNTTCICALRKKKSHGVIFDMFLGWMDVMYLGIGS